MPIIVNPSRDQFVPYNSNENVTFSCEVESGRSAIWEVTGTQVQSQDQRKTFEGTGVFIHGEGNCSTISVSFEARRSRNRPINLLCVANQNTFSQKGDTYYVVSFGKWVHSAWLCFVQSVIYYE